MKNSNKDYKVGQVWTYKTRKGEENSYLTILKIEDYPKAGVAIHIAIDKLNIKGPRTGKFYGHTISHMPFSLTALDKSVTNIKKESSDLPRFQEGYNNWKESFVKGDAGIFSITVAEAIEFIETTLDQ